MARMSYSNCVLLEVTGPEPSMGYRKITFIKNLLAFKYALIAFTLDVSLLQSSTVSLRQDSELH